MRKPQVKSSGMTASKFMRLFLIVVGVCVVFMTLQGPDLFKPRLVSVPRSGAQKIMYEPPDNQKPRRHLVDPLLKKKTTEETSSTSEPTKSKSSSSTSQSSPSKPEQSSPSKPEQSSPSKSQSSPAKSSQNTEPIKSSQKVDGSSKSKPDTKPTSPAAASLPSPGSSAGLIRAAESARTAGRKMWELVETKRRSFNSTSLHRLGGLGTNNNNNNNNNSTLCPQVLIVSGDELRATDNVMVIPCGLTSGSSITLVGRALKAHAEDTPHIRILMDGEKEVMVSQFMVELRGLKLVDGEEPPRILHVNPRLKGDWSSKSVIELNTCYRGQWGTAQRCEGWLSSEDEEAVDGLPKCENWQQDDGNKSSTDSNKAKSSWLNRWIPKPERGGADWSYPFKEERLFVMTIRAGWEGYHVSVDGRHITSFPYRTGFILEEATGFAIAGDVEVRSVVGTALPSTHTSLSSEQVLEESEKYKAPPLPTTRPVHLFIGILSASNHFAERMAVRKTWMQSSSIRFSHAVARFFVALHADLEINLQVREEAEYFGDMVILPFIDHYDLVVLKTVAICEYAVRNISANYIMKTDDDTFVRVETLVTVLKEKEKVREAPGLYMGNINQFHRPLREGKWAVTYEEWPEEEYPPYANGPGYIISSDIAKYILAQEKNNTLRLFKMEDVSMGMWVLQFNANQAVHYVHNLKFCQWGCIEEYYTAHYQSPRQMLCMWDKLLQGEAQCCNMR